MALICERTVRFEGDAQRVLEAAHEAFLRQGFVLESVGSNGFQAVGPGMNSTRQHPLVGVSNARVTVSAGDITIRAELGGIRRMQYFVMFFPAGLVLVLCLIFHVMLPRGDLFVHSSGPSMMLTWMVIGLGMGLWIQWRTTRAIEALLANAAATSERRNPPPFPMG